LEKEHSNSGQINDPRTPPGVASDRNLSPDIAGAAESPGMAFAWGDNSYGKLGNGLTGGAKNVPAAVSDSGVSRA
jgi:hypothetical protein